MCHAMHGVCLCSKGVPHDDAMQDNRRPVMCGKCNMQHALAGEARLMSVLLLFPVSVAFLWMISRSLTMLLREGPDSVSAHPWSWAGVVGVVVFASGVVVFVRKTRTTLASVETFLG